ncbi:MAG: Gfo/Idh/MocA family oxidoreductase [Acidimicrobiia bacterium]|nr:Gfo/Idh/MocA family oxidoreductase [Acidimicrobiia bacterium]
MAFQGTGAGESPVRVGLIGCGDIARRVHLPGLTAAGARVIRFASLHLADAEAAASASGDAEAMATDDWRQVVASPHIDAVDICAPNHLHAEMALAALEHGKHVLVESPMAITVAEADAMLKAAARKGVMVIPAHSVRFIGPYAAMAAAARDGRIGTLTAAEIAFGHDGPDHRNPAATWYFEKHRSGGGPLMDLGVAQIDLLRSALGSEVTDVSAIVRGQRGEVEEEAEVRLTFANGASGVLRSSWARPENHVVIRGTDGTLHLDASTPLTLTRPDGSQERVPTGGAESNIEAVFVAAVARDEMPTVNAADGRAAVAAIAAAYESAAAGRAVPVARPAW